MKIVTRITNATPQLVNFITYEHVGKKEFVDSLTELIEKSTTLPHFCKTILGSLSEDCVFHTWSQDSEIPLTIVVIEGKDWRKVFTKPLVSLGDMANAFGIPITDQGITGSIKFKPNPKCSYCFGKGVETIHGSTMPCRCIMSKLRQYRKQDLSYLEISLRLS